MTTNGPAGEFIRMYNEADGDSSEGLIYLSSVWQLDRKAGFCVYDNQLDWCVFIDGVLHGDMNINETKQILFTYCIEEEYKSQHYQHNVKKGCEECEECEECEAMKHWQNIGSVMISV